MDYDNIDNDNNNNEGKVLILKGREHLYILNAIII